MEDIVTSGELGRIVPIQQPAAFAAALRGFFNSDERGAVARRLELGASLVSTHVAKETAARHLEFMGLHGETESIDSN